MRGSFGGRIASGNDNFHCNNCNDNDDRGFGGNTRGGPPMVCFHCLKEGHGYEDCRREPRAPANNVG